jgi:hypothetical protein
MRRTTANIYLRLVLAVTASVVLFVAVLVLFPDRVAIMPVVLLPIWVGFFVTDLQDDAMNRRVLMFALAAGFAALLAGVVVFAVAT